MKPIRKGFIGYAVAMLLSVVALVSFSVPDALGQPAITSTIGDFVWNDLNRNGIQDAGEPGVQDIEVALLYWYSSLDSPVTWMTTLSDSGGLYRFEGLSFNANVHYYLEFTVPDETWSFSPGMQGGDRSMDSDVIYSSLLTGRTDYIMVGVNVVDLTFDAGIFTNSNDTVPVPEPATMLLLGSGLLGLAGLSRRTRLFRM